ncbi:hypothetical protein F5X68DRAFT_242835 [Plectosphaerella plurivora]|uniref:Rhodopsin domain-containing protein n=1 Tax=Plectosphaerella plurivora TaxID=936078 RepID=A0A9P8V7R4_9PEZI|nr:hypothetical protein F5X68DRAFT_242835 [Plectosphaerella plurivora]
MAIENRGPELLGVNVAFLAAALVSILLRCYVRVFMVKAFGVDDWLMIVAAVFFVLYASFSTAGTRYGTGRHHDDLEDEDIKTAMMCWWFCFLWYCLAMIASKISIGWFLLRVTTSKIHIWIIYIAMASTALSGIVFFFVTMFQCSPIPFFWDKDLPGKCVDIEVIIGLAVLYSVFSVISDFIFAILPGVIVWNLQLHRRTKMLLFPLLAMGCVASSAVVARFPFLPKFREPDFLWNTLDIAIWSSVEQGLAITAGSLATLRPLLKLAGHHLGFTSGPTAYNLSGPPRFGHRSTPSRGNDLELSPVPPPKDTDVFASRMREAKRDRTQTRLTPVGENESMEELHSPRSYFKTDG